MRKNRSLETGVYAAARVRHKEIFCVDFITSISDSEGDQQHTEKDAVSQLVAELAR